MKSNSQKKQNHAQKLYQAVACLEDTAEAKKFLNDLCTPAELQAMVDRWLVVKLLRQEKPYREIYALTGVSVTTIGRVARSLEMGEGGYRLMADRLGL